MESGTDASSPGSRADAAGPELDAGGGTDAGHADAGHADAGHADAGHADAGPPDAGPGGMVIDSVEIVGGFRQARQDSAAELVIRGSGLGQVTDVTVADRFLLHAQDLVVAETEVRATIWLMSGAVPGPRDVTLVAPAGTATAANAFEVTPWVFGPGAGPGGRGTFESPLALAEYGAVDEAQHGDTLLFLAGEHRSDGSPVTNGGVIIMGEGAGTTIIRGETGRFGGFSSENSSDEPIVVRDLTILAGGSAPVLRVSGSGGLQVSDVVMVGGGITSLGPTDGPAPPVRIERLDFDGQGGGGTGFLSTGSTNAAISESRFAACGAGTGVATDQAQGSLVVRDLLVEGCARGLSAVGRAQDFTTFLYVTVSDSQFIDDVEGVRIVNASADVVDVAIEDIEVTLPAGSRGILFGHGYLAAQRVVIRGQDLRGITLSGSLDRDFSAMLDQVEITGGQIGVESTGFPDDNALVMRDCTVRDQTIASVHIDNDRSFFDLGSDGTGGNQLSVVSGFALEDRRDDLFGVDPIRAQGMTLNGNSYAGQLIQGPAESPPDYRITGEGAFQF